jgi:hypothetical protein
VVALGPDLSPGLRHLQGALTVRDELGYNATKLVELLHREIEEVIIVYLLSRRRQPVKRLLARGRQLQKNTSAVLGIVSLYDETFHAQFSDLVRDERARHAHASCDSHNAHAAIALELSDDPHEAVLGCSHPQLCCKGRAQALNLLGQVQKVI